MESRLRKAERYGDVALSIQASSQHACSPQVDGLPLERYDTVELAVLGPERVLTLNDGTSIRTRLCRPSEVGVPGFDHLFDPSMAPVAPDVSWDDVERLRAALRARQRALEEAPSAWDDAPLDKRPTRSRHPAPGKARGGDAAERLQERGR